jgi:hypothetical protein
MVKEKKSDLVSLVRIPEGMSAEKWIKEACKTEWYEWPYVLYLRYIVVPIQETILYIKRFIQRGYRGYGDSDMWSMHAHITEVTLKMLKHLKKIAHGHPVFKDLSEDKYGAGMKRWKNILQQMIDGFQILYDCDYGIKEWGGYCNIKQKKRMEKAGIKFTTKEEEKKVKIAFELLVKYYHSLWD